MTPQVNLADLGRRAKALRLARQLTLDDVVSRTDFTVSWLSKLENGLLTPSLEGLARLATALDCGVDELVEGLLASPRHVVVERDNGRVAPLGNGRNGIKVEHLADSWRGRSMDPVILHLKPGRFREAPISHEGERFLFLLAGEVDLDYGGERLQLREGDSSYLDATVPHTLTNRGRSTARVLCVAVQNSGTALAGLPRRRRSAGVDGAKTGSAATAESTRPQRGKKRSAQKPSAQKPSAQKPSAKKPSSKRPPG